MAVYDVVAEELSRSCGNLLMNADWQCPECWSLNKWQEHSDDDEDDPAEQICMICATAVEHVKRTVPPQPSQC